MEPRLVVVLAALSAAGCRLEFDPIGCKSLDDDTIALYNMSSLAGDELADATGEHPGRVVGSSGELVAEACGLAYASSPDRVVVIDDSPAFDLDSGSVEARAVVPTIVGEAQQTVISRDASGTEEPGHFQLLFADSGQVVVRLQNEGGSFFRCSDELPAGRVVDIAVNFGGTFELFVDGERASTPTGRFTGSEVDCTGSISTGIAGNNNPWVFGASTGDASNGSIDVLNERYTGVIDEVRISRARRSP